MKYVYVGIDPGTRNIGVALMNGRGVPATKYLQPGGTMEAIRMLHEQFQAILTDAEYQVRAVGIENYGFFGPRTGGYQILLVVGAVLGMAVTHGWPVYLFMPREKEKVSASIARPVGMTDHEYDAICVAALAKTQHNNLKVRSTVKGDKG